MPVSQTSILSKPQGTEKVPAPAFAYMRSRNRQRLYSLIIDEFEKSQLSQADLSKRLGKGPDQVCRWLSAPGNLQLDTVSDLLFAMNGGEIEYSLGYPFDTEGRNTAVRKLEMEDA